jgi:hypothetical protein
MHWEPLQDTVPSAVVPSGRAAIDQVEPVVQAASPAGAEPTSCCELKPVATQSPPLLQASAPGSKPAGRALATQSFPSSVVRNAKGARPPSPGLLNKVVQSLALEQLRPPT